MRWPHPLVFAVGAFIWLILGLLLWQIRTERQATATAQAELRIYIHAASQYATKAMIAEGQRDQCLAQF